jgi:hypothetical protein
VKFQDAQKPLSGMKKFLKLYAFYGNANSTWMDRTGTIRIPIRMKNISPLPAMRPMKKTLEEICNDRARELLSSAESLSVDIHVMWSGGIDSTLVLVSLLKNATAEQKKHIVVLLTRESIMENPNFYSKYVRGQLQVVSANALPYLIGTKRMLVGGEGNDQLFGPGLFYKKLIEHSSMAALHQSYNRNLFFNFYRKISDDEALVNFYLDLVEGLRDKAPIPVTTNADFVWWEKFVIKWQSVKVRQLIASSPRNRELVTKEWMDTLFPQFFMTDEFQLWSMQNTDKRIKDSWKTHKWPCKDIIFDFTKDADYHDNKTKWGSLAHVFVQMHTYSFVDEHGKLYDSLDPEEYYEPKNDFL